MFSNKMSKVTPISGFGFLSSAVNLSHKKTNTITNKNPEMQKDDVGLYGDEKTKMKKAEHLHNCRLSYKFEHTQREASRIKPFCIVERGANTRSRPSHSPVAFGSGSLPQ